MMQVVARLHRHDEWLLHCFLRCRRSLLDRVMTAATRLGDPAIVIGFTLLLLAIGPTRAVGWKVAAMVTLSHVAVQLLKRTVNRPRPALPVGIEALLQAPDRFSFPSGHAAASLSVALGLSAFVPTEIAPLVLVVGLVTGVSRCYLGLHYPGDVAAGWMLGWLAYLVV